MRFFLLLLYFFIPSLVLANDLYDSGRNIRALGMGDAYIGLANHADSLFYNPAGISRSREAGWTILDPSLGVSGVDAVAQMASAQSQSGYSGLINGLYDKNIWLGGQAKTAIFFPHFAVAAYDNVDSGLAMHNPAFPQLNLNYINDTGVAMGGGFTVMPGVNMGIVGKRVVRKGVRESFGPSFLGTLNPDDVFESLNNSGIGYGVDMGLTFGGTTNFSPSLSFVWKNIGTTKYTPEGTSAALPTDPEEMNVGLAWEMDLGLISFSPAIDIKMLNRNDVQLGKKIHMGMEIGLPLIDLRAGLNQGYYTLGMGFGLGPISIDFATYGEELGEYPGQQEDRRYLLQATLQLAFDADFTFMGSSTPGERHKRLKQRR